jgi:L-ascorbate metabolism protein UlaG (beta-lactamase superfamily)
MEIGIGAQLTWLGHAAFRLTMPDRRVVLIDPWLSGNPACPAEHKHVDRCDIILITHGHGDHVGDTVEIARRTGARVVAMVEIAEWLSGKGIKNAVGMNKGGTVNLDGIRATMVHAYHSSSIRDGDRSIYGGEASGFVISLPSGFGIYHAGDTNVFGDMKLIGELYKPDMALLPIGGHYTMSPHEAAMAVRLLGVSHVVPMHHGTFPVLTGTPSELSALLSDLPTVTVHQIKPGDSLS